MCEEHLKFIEWAKTYDTAETDQWSRALHEEWLKRLPCPLHRVDGTKPVDKLLKEIESTSEEINDANRTGNDGFDFRHS